MVEGCYLHRDYVGVLQELYKDYVGGYIGMMDKKWKLAIGLKGFGILGITSNNGE